MACQKCKATRATRPPDFEAPINRLDQCLECFGQHDWVRSALHNNQEFCRLCNISRRKIGVNDPCPGKPLRVMN